MLQIVSKEENDMKMWRKRLALIMCAGLIAAAFAGTALAAETRTKISKIELTVESDIQAGEDSGSVNVTANDSSYTVTDVEIVNDEGEWVSGDVPRVEVTIEADDDYYFGAMSSSKVKLRGSDSTYVTSHREDKSSTLIMTIKLDALEGSMEIEEVNWEDESSPVAAWESADGAKSYQVRLYRGSSSVGSAVTTTESYYNFAGSITRTGEYYFKVRAVNSNNKKGDWYESDYIYVDEQMLSNFKSGNYTNHSGSGSGTNTSASPGGTFTEQWIKDNVGWWYRFSDGSCAKNGWLLINNVWYCFDASGYMRTGWIQAANGVWYYCDSSGAMLTNTRTPDGYWVDANGVWVQ